MLNCWLSGTINGIISNLGLQMIGNNDDMLSLKFKLSCQGFTNLGKGWIGRFDSGRILNQMATREASCFITITSIFLN